jgi:hypothetical protein
LTSRVPGLRFDRSTIREPRHAKGHRRRKKEFFDKVWVLPDVEKDAAR